MVPLTTPEGLEPPCLWREACAPEAPIFWYENCLTFKLSSWSSWSSYSLLEVAPFLKGLGVSNNYTTEIRVRQDTATPASLCEIVRQRTNSRHAIFHEANLEGYIQRFPLTVPWLTSDLTQPITSPIFPRPPTQRAERTSFHYKDKKYPSQPTEAPAQESSSPHDPPDTEANLPKRLSLQGQAINRVKEALFPPRGKAWTRQQKLQRRRASPARGASAERRRHGHSLLFKETPPNHSWLSQPVNNLQLTWASP